MLGEIMNKTRAEEVPKVRKGFAKRAFEKAKRALVVAATAVALMAPTSRAVADEGWASVAPGYKYTASNNGTEITQIHAPTVRIEGGLPLPYGLKHYGLIDFDSANTPNIDTFGGFTNIARPFELAKEVFYLGPIVELGMASGAKSDLFLGLNMRIVPWKGAIINASILPLDARLTAQEHLELWKLFFATPIGGPFSSEFVASVSTNQMQFVKLYLEEKLRVALAEHFDWFLLGAFFHKRGLYEGYLSTGPQVNF
jgi:hypothetical protein